MWVALEVIEPKGASLDTNAAPAPTERTTSIEAQHVQPRGAWHSNWTEKGGISRRKKKGKLTGRE